MYVLSTDVVVEMNEKKKVMMCGMDLPGHYLYFTLTWSLALQSPVRHAQ